MLTPDERTEMALAFLQMLYPNAPNVWGYVCRPMAPKRYWESRWFRHSELGYGPFFADRWSNAGSNVYFGICWLHRPRGMYQRGTIGTVSVFPGFWADLDVAGHLDNNGQPTGQKYPPLDIALATIKAMPLRPSLVIDSGGGLYPFWLLHEPFEIKLEEDRDRIASSVKRWQALLRLKLPSEFSLDSTADLARVLRLPGTINQKYGRLVSLLEPARFEDLSRVKRYSLDDLEYFLPPEEPKSAPVLSTIALAGVHPATSTSRHRVVEQLAGAYLATRFASAFARPVSHWVLPDSARSRFTTAAIHSLATPWPVAARSRRSATPWDTVTSASRVGTCTWLSTRKIRLGTCSDGRKIGPGMWLTLMGTRRLQSRNPVGCL